MPQNMAKIHATTMPEASDLLPARGPGKKHDSEVDPGVVLKVGIRKYYLLPFRTNGGSSCKAQNEIHYLSDYWFALSTYFSIKSFV